MLRQSHQQKMMLKLSPKQIQLMKLLQVSTASLEERIKEELESNPALDVNVDYNVEENNREKDDYEKDFDKDFDKEFEDNSEYSSGFESDNLDLSSYLQSENDANGYYHNSDDDDEEVSNPIRLELSFHDYLIDQLGLLVLTDDERIVAEQIIGSIDDDGYLRRDPISITDDLAFKQNIYTTDEEVIRLIKKIQEFDPPGVGALDLRECLSLQLKRLPQTKNVINAQKILNDYFEEFSKKHFDKLKSRLKIDDEEFKDTINIILKLTPKPGIAFDNTYKNQNYVIPDFFVRNNHNKLELTLNSKNAPELHISENYKDMFKAYNNNKSKNKRDKEAIIFIKQKIDSAKWFIDAIKQRQHTLLITMDAIMNYQYDYLLTGDESYLKPMILKDIADITHMDISTVSRVANSKYVQTEFGTFSLKHFFSEATTNDSGEEISTREVKKILTDLVEAEDKHKPLSDEQLMFSLNEKGYQVARRTVAKYREQLNIPVARMRKNA